MGVASGRERWFAAEDLAEREGAVQHGSYDQVTLLRRADWESGTCRRRTAIPKMKRWIIL